MGQPRLLVEETQRLRQYPAGGERDAVPCDGRSAPLAAQLEELGSQLRVGVIVAAPGGGTGTGL